MGYKQQVVKTYMFITQLGVKMGLKKRFLIKNLEINFFASGSSSFASSQESTFLKIVIFCAAVKEIFPFPFFAASERSERAAKLTVFDQKSASKPLGRASVPFRRGNTEIVTNSLILSPKFI